MAWLKKSDPAYLERRIEWLRHKNKKPLRIRAKKVLGDDGEELLDELSAATPGFRRYDKFNAQVYPIGFDDNARSILRACAKLPTMKKRLAYFRECIRNAAKGGPDDKSSGMDALVARVGDAEAGRLAEMLFKAIPMEEWEKRVNRILGKAAKARNAGNFIRACIRNEREQKRRK